MPLQNATATLAGVSSMAAGATVHAAAAVALAAGATFGPAGSAQHHAVSSLAGVSATTDTAAVQHAAVTSLAGLSTLTAATADHDHAFATMAGLSTLTAGGHIFKLPTASLVGTGIFFIDPTKVTVASFFIQQAPRTNAAFQPAPRQAVPGFQQGSVSVGFTRKTPSSNTGGVPVTAAVPVARITKKR